MATFQVYFRYGPKNKIDKESIRNDTIMNEMDAVVDTIRGCLNNKLIPIEIAKAGQLRASFDEDEPFAEFKISFHSKSKAKVEQFLKGLEQRLRIIYSITEI